MSNRIYTFELNSDFDKKVKEFEKQLKEGEEIISTQAVGNRLIITTKESKVAGKKLLLENAAE